MELYKGCPVQFTLQFLAGKWRAGILWNLRNAPLRYTDLRDLLPGISDKVLMSELHFFHTKGILERCQYKEFPPRIEYKLSEVGTSLLPLIQQIILWGYDHLQDAKLHQDMTMTPVSIITELERLSASE